MSADFTGRTAVITGGSTGIGEATAALFASRGAEVCIVGRNSQRLEEATARITAGGGQCWSIAADVAIDEDLVRIVDTVLERSGSIDVLVNEPFLEASRQGWERVFAVNLTAPFRLTQLAARAMVGTGRGAVVNIASIDAYGTDGPYASYNASKAALLALTRQAATELAMSGIRVNSVSPGYTKTAMVEEALTMTSDEMDNIQGRFRRVPMQRMLTPDEIASAIVYLASDAASGITGTDLVVEGGTLANLYIIETLDS